MKTLIFGAGPLGCLYTHILTRAGKDVTLLARGHRYDSIAANGLVLVDEQSGIREYSNVKVVNQLNAEDEYDLVIVLIRKNKLEPVFPILAANHAIKNILFMGNNALGFEKYFHYLPEEKVLFGFPGAGGGIKEDVVHYADREKAGGKRKSITLGEANGVMKKRTRSIKMLFETSGIPVSITGNIDGWLKYHAALICPLACALYKHGCDNYALAKDEPTLRTMIRAATEGGRVLKALGYAKREPFQFNLFYWLPEKLNVIALQGLFESKFAEIAFTLHAGAAQDEVKELALEFKSLINKTNLETPNINRLMRFIL